MVKKLNYHVVGMAVPEKGEKPEGDDGEEPMREIQLISDFFFVVVLLLRLLCHLHSTGKLRFGGAGVEYTPANVCEIGEDPLVSPFALLCP